MASAIGSEIKNGTDQAATVPDPEPECLGILDADHVYLLMSRKYRIARNRRAEWYFDKLNSVIRIPKKTSIVRLFSYHGIYKLL